MTPISSDDFLEVLEHLESMDPEQELEPLIDRFVEEQPLLASFLDEMGGDDLNEEEHEVLFFFGVAIWHCLERHSENPLSTVTIEHLTQIQIEHEGTLETITEEHGHISVEALHQSINGHAQKAMLNEVFDVIREEEKESVRPKNLGDILAYLKMGTDTLLKQSAD